MYRLGVDLGTTFTAAAAANGGPPTMVGLGNRALQVPSVMYIREDGEMLFGEAAERRGATDPDRCVREFKRRIGDPVPLLVAGTPYSPQLLAARMLRWVVQTSTTQLGGSPSLLVLTHPANWGPYKLELLAQVIDMADVGTVSTCSEPEAAAVQYASKVHVEAGDRFAVFDLGGGTFDTCIVERTAAGFTILGEPMGIEHLGGVDFDDAVFHHVVSGVQEHLGDGLGTDPETVASLARLRRECVDAKEALSVDVEAVVPVALGGWRGSVRLTRAELNSLIGPAINEAVACVGRALRSAALGPSDLRSVILVGGSSRIPLVSELLTSELGVPIALDTHPKHDVALGAVQVAGTAATTVPEVGPAPAPPPPERLQEAKPGTWPRRAVDTDTDTDTDEPKREGPPAGRRPLKSPSPAVVSEPVSVPPPVSVSPPVSQGASGMTTLRTPGAEEPLTHRRSFGAPGPGRRRSLVAVTASVAVLALAGGLTWALQGNGNGNQAEPSYSPSQPSPSSQASSPAPRLALPVSAALRPEQLVIPMERDGNWDIYLADTRSHLESPTKRLTTDPGYDSNPLLSPDRRTIIYVHKEDVRSTLRVMAVNGTDQRNLFHSVPPGCDTIFRPGWNPLHPSQLAVACSDRTGKGHLYLMRVNGHILREYKTGQTKIDDPAFSPDGKRIAYYGGPGGHFDGGSIYTISVGGGKPERLTEEPAGTDADPAWSKDGQTIAFRRRLDNGTARGNFEIYTMPADRSAEPTRLTHSDAADQDPSWSPYDDQIAFKSNRATASGKGKDIPRVWIMNRDGSAVWRLWTLDGTGEQSAPAWQRR